MRGGLFVFSATEGQRRRTARRYERVHQQLMLTAWCYLSRFRLWGKRRKATTRTRGRTCFFARVPHRTTFYFSSLFSAFLFCVRADFLAGLGTGESERRTLLLEKTKTERHHASDVRTSACIHAECNSQDHPQFTFGVSIVGQRTRRFFFLVSHMVDVCASEVVGSGRDLNFAQGSIAFTFLFFLFLLRARGCVCVCVSV